MEDSPNQKYYQRAHPPHSAFFLQKQFEELKLAEGERFASQFPLHGPLHPHTQATTLMGECAEKNQSANKTGHSSKLGISFNMAVERERLFIGDILADETSEGDQSQILNLHQLRPLPYD